MTVARLPTWRLRPCDSHCAEHERIGADHERERWQQRTVQTGRLVVDLGQQAVWIDGEEIHLSRRDTEVLCALAERVGMWVSKSALLVAVWGSTHYANSLIYSTLTRLRKRLGSVADLVQTDPRNGSRYRLRMVPPEGTP